MIRSRCLVIASSLALTLRAAPAHAQLETFVQAVRELAAATGRTEPARTKDIRAATDRLAAALDEWDRRIAALESRVTGELSTAPAERRSRLHVELGVAYRARGRTVDALREFDAAAALQPSSRDLQILRALVLEASARPDEAGKAFRSAWELAPGDPVVAYYMATRAGAGSPVERERARALLVDASRHLGAATVPPAAPAFATLDAFTDNVWPTPLVGDAATAEPFALLAAHRYGEAVAALRRGARADAATGDSPLARFARAQRDEAGNRVGDARREYQASLAGALAGRSTILVAIARLAQVDGDLPAAIEAFSGAVRISPNDPAIRRELAGAYQTGGRVDAAFCELMAALLIDPRDAQSHAALGQLFLDGGREADAVSALTRALELSPDVYERRYALATAYARLGRSADAARQLDLFDRARRAALERRRQDIANEAEQQERQHR
jgi:tetratricopeptide (TPR) repeat protein